MSKVMGVVFMASWLLCGCSIDSVLDDWRSCVIAVVALLVCVVSAALITGGDE